MTLFSGLANAQETENDFSISAQIRPRFEYRNGAYRPLQQGEEPAILVNNRVRLNFDYKNNNNLRLYVSLQNVNVWGQAPQIQVADKTGGASIFEAYASFPLAKTLEAKIGRQMIVLDDDRIFGSLDWHPAGRSHDAVNLNWKASDKFLLRSFLAFNQNYAERDINSPAEQFFTKDAQPYQHMETFHGLYNISETNRISFLFSNLGFRDDAVADAKTQNMQTFGFHYVGASNDWKYGLTSYFQTGKNTGGATKSAYMFAFNAGYKFSDAFSLTAGLDYLSGKAADDTSDKDKAFNPFSGTNHKFYGFMDYYYVPAVNPVGLVNPYLTVNFRTGEKSSLSATWHHFRSAATTYDSNGNKKSGLGNEIDLVYSLKVQPYIGLQMGYSTYFTTDALKTLKNTPNARAHQDWFWCSLNINPKIFSAKF
ncbi:alginate export family protein [Capnocytophaga sp.]|uniref:alginate export family protein n=1 Tax=Capnocytophaga sp. TaxID=44737 RepID=UPI0026DCCCD9|nr:alginate export family protein [Capnocytophaga sp.]MDO5104739.1 alginate export family protein [Capnocytophaga sp.]